MRGTPESSGHGEWSDWDHPRVCGEHAKSIENINGVMGSSPRMRGTHLLQAEHYATVGIIPAYAGNTEHSSYVRDGERGSSPRMRGTL